MFIDGNFQPFNEAFFKSADQTITWFNKMGIFKLRKGANVEIELTDVGIGGIYDGYEVRVIDVDRGTIVEQTFLFHDFMEVPLTMGFDSKYCVTPEWGSEEPVGWLKVIPSEEEVAKMVARILQYVEFYR